MKTEIIISDVQYIDPEHEAALNEITGRLVSTVELQGKQDGALNRPSTRDEHQAHSINLIEVTLQSAIDLNQKRHLLASGITAAKLVEIEANKKENALQNAINDDEHILRDASNEVKRLQPDVKHMQIRQLVFVGLSFIAVTEGYLSYPAFRHASFPVLPAISACVAIAFAVGITSHHSGGFIKNAQTRAQLILCYLISLLPAIIGFSVLGYMRASAYNHVSNLQVDTDHVIAHPHSASAVSIAIVSVLLYWIALFISSRFFRTKTDRLREHAYEEKCKEVAALKKGIDSKNDEIVRVRYDKIKQMSLAVKRFEYALYLERQLINFAQEAAEAYKQKNLRHRTDGCPAFFCHKPRFNFTTFFNHGKLQNHEAVD